MSAAQIIEAFVNNYTTSLQLLVDEGVFRKPRVEEESTTIYYEFSDAIALELSLDVRDVVVDIYVIHLPDAVKPGVGSIAQGRLVRIPFWQILERLKSTSHEMQEDLKNWRADRERAYNKVYRYLKSLRMPESEVVERLFKTDANYLALILHKHWEAVLAYSMALLRL